jgi:FkbM family methyltransferase
MLRYSKECVAFEPYPRLATLLRNGLGQRLTVHQVALSDHSGHANMTAAPRETGMNTIEPSNNIAPKVTEPDSIETLLVPRRTLDDFELQAVGFIKVDVEGHEEEVLRGAARTLEKYRPALQLELEEQHRSGSRERVAAMLQALGYTGYFVRSGKLWPLGRFDPFQHHNPANPAEYIRNFLFLPDHRIPTFAANIET